jgi:hypothetical protein
MHYLLIKRAFKPLELWILLPIFFLVDLFHLLLTGCGFNDWRCSISEGNEPFIISLYFIMVLAIVLMYTYKIILLKTYDVLKYVHLGLLVLIAFLFQNTDNLQYKFTQTILILFLFLVVLDFIIRIVNKTYSMKMLLFYIRTLTVLFVFMILGTMEFFINPEVEGELLAIMVGVTYVSLSINIIKSQYGLDIPDQNPIVLFRADTSKILVHDCSDEETSKLTDLHNQKAILCTNSLGDILGYFVYEIEDTQNVKSLVVNDFKLEDNEVHSKLIIELEKTSSKYKSNQIIIKNHQLEHIKLLYDNGFLPIKTLKDYWYIKHLKRL